MVFSVSRNTVYQIFPHHVPQFLSLFDVHQNHIEHVMGGELL